MLLLVDPQAQVDGPPVGTVNRSLMKKAMDSDSFFDDLARFQLVESPEQVAALLAGFGDRLLMESTRRAPGRNPSP